MQPRTFAIVAFAILAGSLGMRYLVEHFGLLPISEEVMLKKAAALNVSYFDQGQYKTLGISDPEQLGELLAVLQIQDTENYYYGGLAKGAPGSTPATVSFEFSNGMTRNHSFNGPNNLGGFTVDGRFFTKLSKLASNHEGHNVNLLAQPNLIGPPGNPGWNPDGTK